MDGVDGLHAVEEGNAYRIAYIKDLDGMTRDEREEQFFRKVQSL